MSEPSLTDMTAVRPRGPKIFLAVIGVALVAAGAWWFLLRPAGPIGEPEDPAAMLVIGPPEARDGVDVLGDHGLVITQMTLAEAEAKAAETVGELSGPAAAIRYADHAGIGYVAFAAPSDVSFEGVSLAADAPPLDPAARWAVVSVGDLGIPHVLSVGNDGSTILEVPTWVELMRAYFAQERPAATLFAESQLPMDAIELHKKIASAVEMQGAYNALEARARKLARERDDRLVDHESADPKPAILSGPLDEARALPLANGGVLALVRPRVVEDAFDAEVRLAQLPSTQLWFHPAGQWAPADRVRCESLHGGTLTPGGDDFVLDDTGTALALDVGDRWDVWRLDPAAEGCDFRRLGSVPYPASDETGGTLYAPSGRAMRAMFGLQMQGVRIHDPEGDPVEVDLPGCTAIGQPSWVDDAHFAVVCVYDPEVARLADDDEVLDDELAEAALDDDLEADDDDLEDPGAEPAADADTDAPPEPILPDAQSWLYVVDTATTKIVAIPLASVDPEHHAARLRAAGYGGPPALLFGPDWGQRISGVLRATDSAADLLQRAPADPEHASPPFIDDPTVVALGADAMTWAPAEVVADGPRFDVSPDGTKIVLERSPEGHHDPHGYDIVLVDLADPGTPRTIAASDRAGHDDPRFTADGKAVVFGSRYPVDIDGGLEHAAQIVAIGQ